MYVNCGHLFITHSEPGAGFRHFEREGCVCWKPFLLFPARLRGLWFLAVAARHGRRWRVDLSAVERCQRAQICLLSPSFERCRKRSEPKLNIYLPLVGGPTQTPHGSTAAEPAYANDWRIPI